MSKLTSERSERESFLAEKKELQELVQRILELGRDLHLALGKKSVTQPQEAAWDGLAMIEVHLKQREYKNKKEVLEALELAQEYVAIVFPLIEEIIQEHARQASIIRGYAQTNIPPRSSR